MSGQGEMTDLRQGCSPTVHAVLDLLDKARPNWERLSNDTIEVEIELHTPAPDAPVAELVHGAALMIFLAERRAA